MMRRAKNTLCHSREGGNPFIFVHRSTWIPAFAGMTKKIFFCALFFLLAGCGQSGKLYLPPQTQDAPHAEHA